MSDPHVLATGSHLDAITQWCQQWFTFLKAQDDKAMATLADITNDVTELQGDVTALQKLFTDLQAQLAAGKADQATIDQIDAGLKSVHTSLGAIANPTPAPVTPPT